MDKKDDTIVVSKSKIVDFTEKAGKMVFSQTAETQLLELLRLKDAVDEAIEDVKKKIAEEGLKDSPTFKGVYGAKVKALYQTTGRKYSINRDIQGWEKSPYVKPIYIPDSMKIDSQIRAGVKVGPEIQVNEPEKKIVFRVDET